MRFIKYWLSRIFFPSYWAVREDREGHNIVNAILEDDTVEARRLSALGALEEDTSVLHSAISEEEAGIEHAAMLFDRAERANETRFNNRVAPREAAIDEAEEDVSALDNLRDRLLRMQ